MNLGGGFRHRRPGCCERQAKEGQDISNPQTTDTLGHLIAICEDGVRAFEQAVVEVPDRELKEFFRELSISRKFAAVELRKRQRALGGTATDSGTLAGSALRLYIKMKAAIADKDSGAVLEELERSERRALTAFREAAARARPGDLRDAVREQGDRIDLSLEALIALRENLARPSDSKAPETDKPGN